MLNTCESIVEAFAEKTLENPDRIAIILISDDDSEEKITYGQLYSKAISCARTLQSHDIKNQDIVIICLNHSPELVAAFWGVLYTGAIPIISHYPEHVPNQDKFKEQICSLVKNSGARGVITLPQLRIELGDPLRDLNCQAISTTEILTRPGDIDLSVPRDYPLESMIPVPVLKKLLWFVNRCPVPAKQTGPIPVVNYGVASFMNCMFLFPKSVLSGVDGSLKRTTAEWSDPPTAGNI
jgi:hypothetical protein